MRDGAWVIRRDRQSPKSRGAQDDFRLSARRGLACRSQPVGNFLIGVTEHSLDSSQEDSSLLKHEPTQILLTGPSDFIIQ